MSHVSYSDFRENLASYMDQVIDSGAELHVTRQGHQGVVVVSESEFNGMMETLHLLRSPANALDLNLAIRDLDEGRGVRFDPRD
jgi:antitoxin YefM